MVLQIDIKTSTYIYFLIEMFFIFFLNTIYTIMVELITIGKGKTTSAELANEV